MSGSERDTEISDSGAATVSPGAALRRDRGSALADRMNDLLAQQAKE